MVLSNKKLKQRLRAELVESLANSVATTYPNNDGTTGPDPNTRSQLSLKNLLHSASQRPRLSKREKRRKSLPFQVPEAVKGRSGSGNSEESKGDEEERKGDEGEKEGGSEGLGEKKKKRKRKREQEEVKDGELCSEANGVVKDSKQSKKKKKKKKKKAKGEEEEENKGAELGSERQDVTETMGDGDSQAHEEVTSKVYVGGIPYYSTEEDIRSYFEGCGTITQIDCMKFPETGKFRGIAIISFKTEAAAKRALALDGADMGGLYLKIQPYRSSRTNKESDFAPKIVEGYNRIYVGNLSWDVTEDDLRKHFSDCNMSSVRFGMDKETGEFRGYAHVDFSDSLSLTMALKLDQQLLRGRPVKISCAVPKKGVAAQALPRSSPTSQGVENTETALSMKGVAVQALPRSAPTSEGVENTETAFSNVSSGKIKRRTCYECGEKGHISSACPKKQNVDQTNSSAC